LPGSQKWSRTAALSILFLQDTRILELTTPVSKKDAIQIDIWVFPALQGAIAPFLNMDIHFFVQGNTLLLHRASVMFSTRRTDTLAGYISMSASFQ